MGKPTGFMEIERETIGYRDPLTRLEDWDEIEAEADEARLRSQGARCMDCGVPFCQSQTGCPVNNLIPEWNDLVYQGRFREAIDRLHATNNFPEVTGRVCPAPCEGACVLGIVAPAVTIKNIERTISDRAFEHGWVQPQIAERKTGRSVAIVGSGPAGLAAAQQLVRVGHDVTIYERDDRVGGLLMYGIPTMKLDKGVVLRRVEQLLAEGVKLVTGCEIGKDITLAKLRADHDAVLMATGSTIARDLQIEGRELEGVHFAMPYLTAQTKATLTGEAEVPISAKGKKVVVIGGGDTGTDCIGTALRQGCASVVNFELLPRPPETRAENNPWPEWPVIFRIDYGHAEATARDGEDPRRYAVRTTRFIGEGGKLVSVETIDVKWTSDESGARRFEDMPGTERRWDADLALLAMGFIGPEKAVLEEGGVGQDGRGNINAAFGRFMTNVEGVFAAGDCRRGQSLVVWAIAEGRGAARAIDEYLMEESDLTWPAGAV